MTLAETELKTDEKSDGAARRIRASDIVMIDHRGVLLLVQFLFELLKDASQESAAKLIKDSLGDFYEESKSKAIPKSLVSDQATAELLRRLFDK